MSDRVEVVPGYPDNKTAVLTKPAGVMSSCVNTVVLEKLNGSQNKTKSHRIWERDVHACVCWGWGLMVVEVG